MTPIERAARALCKLAGNPENTKFEGKPMWQSYINEAHAVVQAIREPDDLAISLGALALEHSSPDASNVDLAGIAYQAMIDAVLTGKH